MGRYYNGDIEGKFWFSLQPSSAADRFGVEGRRPEILIYCFDEENLEDVEVEIKNIEESLGEKIEAIADFFEKRDSYNDKELQEAGITGEELREYADLVLGKKIRDSIVETGECRFEAEC